MAYVHDLIDQNIIKPPRFIRDNLTYECMMGSVAYGVSNDISDLDLYGFCIPPKDVLFPHLNGEIIGFDQNSNRFTQFQKHQIKKSGDPKTYDVKIYNIVDFFRLLMGNNPDCLDSLYVPQNCITYSNLISQQIRQNRDRFLHKGSYFRMKGYSYSQLSESRKIAKNPKIIAIRQFEDDHNIPHNTPYTERENLQLSEQDAKKYHELWRDGLDESKRFAYRKIFNWDTKFLYHVVRLMYEAEMILMEGTIELDRYKEHLKAIRRGEQSLDDVIELFQRKEKSLDQLYIDSKLRHNPDEPFIKQLLIDSLEHHYGSLPIEQPDKYKQKFLQIQEICNTA